MGSEKKRIGLLIPEMNRGGAERVVSILTKVLGQSDDVYLILYEKGNIVYPVFSEIIDMNLPPNKGILQSGIVFVRRLRKLTEICRDYHLDVVISFLNSANMVNALSSNHIPKYISVRSYEYGQGSSATLKSKIFNTLYKFVERIIVKRVDGVITVSDLIRLKMVELYPFAENKLCTIYNPFETDVIEKLSEESVAEWGDMFSPDNFVFITVGRLDQPKGWWHLLKIFNEVVRHNSEVRLLIVGEGAYREKISEAIKKLQLEEKVVLVGDQNNPFKYMAKADTYLLTSVREGFPNAMVEAMICGLPIIANDCFSGPKEILYNVRDREHQVKKNEFADYGIITPRLSIEENWCMKSLEQEEVYFVNAMEQIMKDKGIKTYYAKRSKERASDFSCDACLQEFKKLLWSSDER